jgi:heptose-I-phosphate ethanolaminephosphotransferase
MDLMGHNEYHATRPMYEVPLIVWFSDKYKEKRPRFLNLKSIENTRYNLEDFVYSFTDISFITLNKQDSTRSIFSNSFQPRTRWIKEQVDYDNR